LALGQKQHARALDGWDACISVDPPAGLGSQNDPSGVALWVFFYPVMLTRQACCLRKIEVWSDRNVCARAVDFVYKRMALSEKNAWFSPKNVG
jgi:hypothetical protein